jgi:hypothetical protein
VLPREKALMDDKDLPELMSCHFCKREVESAESYCFGCKHCVCEDCEKNHELMGSHRVEEHAREPDVGW